MPVTEEIRERLAAAFDASRLEVIDESEMHRGHAGWRDGGETHFRVVLRAPDLAAMGRLERHRAVHAALGPDLVGRIHALALDLA
ncbi:MAG: BolA family transcriptional regulator [Rhodobacteraceae bacterium]|jgi:BolA protein|nr:BolA family transcriptional regulator [Paracoccaceae bacterium]